MASVILTTGWLLINLNLFCSIKAIFFRIKWREKILKYKETINGKINHNFASIYSTLDYQFEPGEIDQKVILRILEAGQYALAGKQVNLASYAIVQDADRLQYLADYAALLDHVDCKSNKNLDSTQLINQFAHPNNSVKPFHGANCLILACSDLNHHFSADAFWQSIENIAVAINSLNHAVSFLSQELKLFNMENIKSELEIPEPCTVLAALAIGHRSITINQEHNPRPSIWAWK
jgi:nitroreductase